MQRVLFVVWNIAKLGGVGRITSFVANGLAQNYRIFILNVSNKTFETSKYKLDRNVCVLNLKKDKKIAQIFEARKIIKQFKIGVVVVQTKNLYYFTYLKYLVKSKILFVDHDSIKAYPLTQINENKPRMRACRNADLVISLTEDNKEEYIKRFSVKEKKIKVIPNFINISESSASIKYDFASKEIVAVGRYHRQKRFDLLIQSFALISKEYPDWKLKIYGDGELRGTLQKLIDENCLSDQIILCGEFKNADEAYGNKAFLCLTSEHEGFGLVLLEGFAYKLPAISFCCPSGPSEIINNNENGFLIKNFDVIAFSEAMKKLIDDTNLRKKFSESTILSLNRFDKKIIIRQWKEILK